MKNAALYIALALLAGACASKETKTEAPIQDRSTGVQTPSQATTAPQTTPRAPAQPIAGNPLKEGMLANRSVFFDFDSNAVKDEYRGWCRRIRAT
jgi:peptidoglycan-associated lipoprotein